MARRATLSMCVVAAAALVIVAATCFPEATVTLSDLDRQALSLAAENVRFNDLGSRVFCLQADLLAPLAAGSVDLILSNPPYVSAAEMRDLPAEYEHEPRVALEAEAEGTALALAGIEGGGGAAHQRGFIGIGGRRDGRNAGAAFAACPFYLG